MDVRCVFKKCLILCVMLFSAWVSAEEAKFSQTLSWQTNAYALAYKVEVQDVATKKSTFITTETTSTELSLPAGEYRYRVTAYDFLGREAETSKWTTFTVLQAGMPEIRSVEKSVTIPKSGEKLEIAVDIAHVSADSVIELVGESVTGEIGNSIKKGGETETISKVYFDDVPPGKWRIRVTNASGLSAESDVIEINGKQSKSAKTEKKETKSEPQTVVQKEPTPEEIAAEEEKQRLAYERQQQETAEAEMRRKIEEAKEEERKRKKQYREEHPYIAKDISFQAGVGYAISPYDGTLNDYNQDAGSLAIMGRIAFLPIKTEKNRFGFELVGWRLAFSKDTTYYESALTFIGIGAHVVWRHRLFSEKTFFALKGGGGACVVNKSITYARDADLRTLPEKNMFVYPMATAGASFVWIPATFCIIECGADFSHLAISGMPTGMVIPYISIGLRL